MIVVRGGAAYVATASIVVYWSCPSEARCSTRHDLALYGVLAAGAVGLDLALRAVWRH